MKTLSTYSFGVGDRFAHQAKAQLQAIKQAEMEGVTITPVWNKSYREHQIIGSDSATTRKSADRAVRALDWKKDYFVDADHINKSNVDFFMDSCDFFTLDVADYIGKKAGRPDIEKFVDKNKRYIGELELPGTSSTVSVTENLIRSVAARYLYAVQEAGRIYRHITRHKTAGSFVVEVSMDETETPQSPIELFFILAGLAAEKIPAQTIAPKFSGRFNKGVDYVGNVDQFSREFERDVAVIKIAIDEFGLPENLKLSVHSGSDKFSLYPVIRGIIRKHGVGLHLKTAGTSWLEELIGLAESGGDGLQLAKEIYRQSLVHFDDLCGPYSNVIDIDREKLPAPEQIAGWDGKRFATSLRHDQSNEFYNLHFRQLLHVGYKTAAKTGERYLEALQKNDKIIAKNVTENLFNRHIKSLFL